MPATPAGDTDSAGSTSAGTLADAATAERVRAFFAAVAACQAARDFAGEAALYTDAWLLRGYAVTDRTQAAAALRADRAGSIADAVFAVRDVRTHGDGRVSAEVDTITGGHWLRTWRYDLVEEGGALRLLSAEARPPRAPAGSVVVGVAMVEYAYELSRVAVPAGAPLVLRATNKGRYDHELQLLRLPADWGPENLVAGRPEPLVTRRIGFTFARPGETGDLVVVNLEPGVYTLACFWSEPGRFPPVPHVRDGMVAQLIVG